MTEPVRVEVWETSLVVDEPTLAVLVQWLAPDELARMSRLGSNRLRRRFVVAHAFLRAVLGNAVGILPREISFERESAGKPRLADPLRRQSGLEFNLSHSVERALVALARGTAVGVDVERIDCGLDWTTIAPSVLAQQEIQALLDLPEAQRSAAFFVTWTRKEAFVKARGSGLAAMPAFAVTVDPRQPPGLLAGSDQTADAPWSFTDLWMADRYTACVVAAAGETTVSVRRWAARQVPSDGDFRWSMRATGGSRLSAAADSLAC